MNIGRVQCVFWDCKRFGCVCVCVCVCVSDSFVCFSCWLHVAVTDSFADVIETMGLA